MKSNTFERGFIALTSIIFIAITLELGVLASSYTLNNAIYALQRFEDKVLSTHYADACIQLAILQTIQNIHYAGNETYMISPRGSCSILPVTSLSSQRISLQAEGYVGHAKSFIQIQFDTKTLEKIY